MKRNVKMITSKFAAYIAQPCVRVLFIAVSFSLAASAQLGSGPCLPDCEQDLFGPTQTIQLEICSGQWVSVEYSYRIACNTWYDYSIEFIEGPVAEACVTSLGGINGVLQRVSEMLIIENPAGFPPLLPNECETNWRVMKGSCWRPDIVYSAGSVQEPQGVASVGGFDLLYPCSTSDCCLEAFTVCVDQFGDKVITNTGYLPPQDPECIMDGGPFEEDDFFRCHPVCGSIYNR